MWPQLWKSKELVTIFGTGTFTLIWLVSWVFRIFQWLLLARIIFSFIQLGRNTHPLILSLRRISYRFTEPVLAPVRNVVKPVSVGGGAYLDLSPILVLILLPLVQSLVFGLLRFF
ncbi:YggT family protein [Dethiobacter alkaliphilus]|uniref:YggT family protein n=1 Tax=Dethiobacter alkaliphilus TaxID=427926 RepID=UPI002227692C|nr:YggT family protein [Dethiobacter alkaliphilus]MCW3491211.1 YggT family protein [Dethiobacter alkaliphilus]